MRAEEAALLNGNIHSEQVEKVFTTQFLLPNKASFYYAIYYVIYYAKYSAIY